MTRLSVFFGLVVAAGVVGLVYAQQRPTVKVPTTSNASVHAQKAYDGGDGTPFVAVDSAPQDTKIKAYGGLPVGMTATGKGLAVDIGLMHREMGADHQWRPIEGKAHTIVTVPMDMTTSRITVSPSKPSNDFTTVTVEDHQGNHLRVTTLITVTTDDEMRRLFPGGRF